MADVVAVPQIEATDLGSNAPDTGDSPPEVVRGEQTLLPLSKMISVVDLIHHWQPMGIRVEVTLPFVGDDRHYLFLIRPQPHIPWIPHLAVGGFNFMRIYDRMRNVIHDFDREEGAGSLPTLPTSIHITQHSPPPYLAMMANIHRKWRGSIKYRIRSVTNFTAQGYVITSFLRRCATKNNEKNFFQLGTVTYRVDSTYNQSMYTAWMSSDLSMFRHIQCIAPYEYVTPWRDFEADLLRADTAATSQRFNVNLENMVAVGLRGTFASADTQNQLFFELEYCAGDDFELALPIPPGSNSMMAAFSDTPGSDPVANIASTGVTIPTTAYSTNGSTTLTMTSRSRVLDAQTRMRRASVVSSSRYASAEELRRV